MSWDYFQNSRTIPEAHKKISCYAPFNHMRIRRDGDMSPCCFSLKKLRWKKGEVGLKDYWFGSLNEEYQSAMLGRNLHSGCGHEDRPNTCGNLIKNKIIPPINDYDHNAGEDRLYHALNSVFEDTKSMPKIFEFEISNLCNMACPMCMGNLSSKHMLGRDKDLMKYEPNVFDDDDNLNELIDQFEEFIPHLDEIRFVGGEPFAHKGFFKICDRIADINPDMSVQVCTNGSVYNKKVEKISKQNKLKLSVSIDTVIPEEYKQIRIGGQYQQTFENIQKFKNTAQSVMINATIMSINVGNISKFFHYAIENNLETFINTYSRLGRSNSPDWSLNRVDKSTLQKSIEELESIESDLHSSQIHQTIKLIQNSLLD